MALGHDSDCMCITCINEELTQVAAAQGVTWGTAERANYTPERTRYATPGTQCGNGVVRVLSEKQIKFIKYLMSSRDTSNLVRLPGSENIEHMSLRGASDLIERLLACPEKPRYVRPATEAQLSYIRSLCQRKGMTDLSGDVHTFDKASETITALKALQDAPRPAVARPEPLAVGIYRHADGRIVQVTQTRDGKRRYGKLYSPEGKAWEYAPGLLAGLTAADRLTLEECKDLSVELGACCLCGRTLTATVNGVPPRDRYIGPICGRKLS